MCRVRIVPARSSVFDVITDAAPPDATWRRQ